MDASTFIDPIKRHPFILIGGVVLVIVFIQLRSRNSAAAQSSGPGVYSQGVDPNQIALQGQQQALAAQTAQASIQAATAKSYIDMMGNVQTAQINAGQTVSLAEITAAQQTANAGIGASMFGTAVQGVTANYISQLKANGASNISYSSSISGSGSSGGTGANASGLGGGNSFSISNAGNFGTTTPNPAGSSVINTANTQIEQMFNNVLRAGAGIGPLETALITDGGGSTQQTTTPPKTTTPGSNNASQAGHTGSHDPIFVNWLTGQAMPTVTDITPSASSPFGWVGSFVNGNTGATQTIH